MASLSELLDILVYPDPFLLKPCRKITEAEIKAGRADGWDLAELVARMKATMYAAEGIGLAAPQVGVGLRLFVIDISKEKKAAFEVLNPQLQDVRGSVLEEEGCLSLPGVRAKVKRFAAGCLAGVNLQGAPIALEEQDLLARVCQHETDHLDGILFIHKVGMTAKLMLRRRLQELEDQYALRQHRRKARLARSESK